VERRAGADTVRAMADVEFFFDPICPWAWVTSRWTAEVARLRSLHVEWRPICLRIVNEQRNYEREFPAGYVNSHTAGQQALRVAAAVQQSVGNEAVGRLYTELGTRFHDQGRSVSEVREGNFSLIPEAVTAAGLDASFADAMTDEGLDGILRSETDIALARTGKDVGTPIITFGPGDDDEASFFGPVINRIPRGDEALRIWDAVEFLARTPGFYELKRTTRERPVFT
jgi:hypothetical protein